MTNLTKTDNKDGWLDHVYSATKGTALMMVDYAKDQPFNTCMAVMTGLALTAKAWPIAAVCTGLALINAACDTLMKGAINDSSLYALKAVWAQSDKAAKEKLIQMYILDPRQCVHITREDMDSMINVMDKTLASV
jgi:hypothetical protein